MKKFLTSPVGLVLLLALPVVAFSWYIATHRVEDDQLSDVAPYAPRERTTVVGGVERPATDVATTPVSAESPLLPHEEKQVSRLLGVTTCPKTPRLVRGRNRQMDSMIEALETGKHPERLSPLIAATPFDRLAWRNDPKVYRAAVPKRTPEKLPDGSSFVNAQSDPNEPGYLDVAEPGRVFDTEQPAAEVPPLKNVTWARNVITEGESVELKVLTLPHAPVSFTAFGVGAFQNGLTAITVEADADGHAIASFTGTTAPNELDVLAGSPVASGTIRFQVSVVPPAP